MKRNELKSEIAATINIDESKITDSFDLSSQSAYDSIAIMSMIAFLDERFGKTFSPEELTRLTNIQSIVDLVGPEHFED